MHESIAKAEIKGTFRKVNSELDRFNEDVMAGAKNTRISKKGIQGYVDEIVSIYGNLLLVQKGNPNQVLGTLKALLLQ
jgi:hypothetical protein